MGCEERKKFVAHLVAKMKSFDFSCRMFKTPENVQKFTFAECREEAVNKRYRGYLATWSEKDIKAVLRQGFLLYVCERKTFFCA